MKKRNNGAGEIVKMAILIFLAGITLFPLYFTVVSSFKQHNEYIVNMFGLPRQWTTDNFIHFFQRYDVWQMYRNSAIVTFISLLLMIFLASLAGFIFAKFPYKYSDNILAFIIAFMMVPPMVLLIPVYLMMAKIGLINSYLSLILFYVAFYMPFSVYLMTANFKSIPDECIDAARLDGAGMFRIYRDIGLPLCRPTIMTLFTLSFLWCWNEFSYSMMLLQKPEIRTLTVGVATVIGKNQTDMPLLYSGLLVNCVPVLVLFVFGQKYLQKGLVAGAVK